MAGVTLVLPPPNHVEGELGAADRRSGRRQTSRLAIELEPLLGQQRAKIAIFQYGDHRGKAWDRKGDPARQTFARQSVVNYPCTDARRGQMRQGQIKIQSHLLAGGRVAAPHCYDKVVEEQALLAVLPTPIVGAN